MLLDDLAYFGVERRPRLERSAAADAPRAAIVPPAVVGAAVRHRALDGGAQRVQVVRQIARVERRAHRHHAAADVDADRRRDDRLVVGMTLPTVAPLPRWTSGITAIQR